MKIIIAGSRTINDYNLLKQIMIKSNAKAKVTEIFSGAAKGVDKLGERWAKDNKVKLTLFPARWQDLDAPGAVVDVHPHPQIDGYYNSRAGLQRNEEMGDKADAAVILWDGKSRGTKHMIDYMKKLGKRVFVHIVEGVKDAKEKD